MEIMEFTNPRVLEVPAIRDLFVRAFDKTGFEAHSTDTIILGAWQFVQDDNYFVLSGAEDGSFKSLLIGFYPTSPLFPIPTITLIYNEGSRELRRATQAKAMDMLLARGYTTVWGFHTSGKHRDAAWLKALKTDGIDGQIIGSIGKFSVK